VLHLAWHYDLRDDEQPFDEGVWFVPALDEDSLLDVRTSARLIARTRGEGRVPYGFARADAHYDARGTLVLGASLGLTCSELVLIVFQHAGVDLLDEATWDTGRSKERRVEDDCAQTELLGYLERSRDPEARAQADRVRAQVGVCTRIRAEEVAAGSGLADQPVSYARAEPIGREVLDRVLGLK
jgi:hypothetical protein